jgi:hypothetical protein
MFESNIQIAGQRVDDGLFDATALHRDINDCGRLVWLNCGQSWILQSLQKDSISVQFEEL